MVNPAGPVRQAGRGIRVHFGCVCAAIQRQVQEVLYAR